MSDQESDAEQDVLDDTVVNKYKMAAEVTNAVLLELIGLCVDGARIVELCELGDKRINEKVSQLFKKEKEMKKDNKVTGRKADVIIAAHTAAEAVLRSLRPSIENSRASEIVGKATVDFNCHPVEGKMLPDFTLFSRDSMSSNEKNDL
ncbi:unnamed protein product [Heterobilharzia americana]|nr:unnamed protein product [Heterobilharzia americana]